MIINNEINKKITQYIGLSFINQELLILLKEQKEFQKSVNLLINILVKTQDNKDEESVKMIDSFKITFTEIVGSYDSNITINLEDEDEILDNIRYFEIFIQNSLNKSIDEVIKQTSNTDEKVIPDTVIDSKNNNEDYSNSNHQQKNHNHFNAEEYIHNAGTNVNEIAEMMVRQQATMIVNRKIMSGQVFIYNSKPKIIPILKLAIAILFGLLLILTVTSSIILLYLNNKIIVKQTVNNQEQTGSYVFLPFPATLIFTILINGLIIFSLIKNFKNENAKFHVNWMWPLIYTSILLITLLMESGTGRSIIFNPDALKAFFQQNQSPNWQQYWQLIEQYRYIQFANIAIIITILVVLIISIAYNPKRDLPRIEKLIVEYMNKIKNGEISNDEKNSTFGSKFSSELF